MPHVTVLALSLAALVVPAPKADEKSSGKPAVSLRAAPRVSVAPARIVFTVELKGGEDSEALHCLTFAWEWGDGTKSSTEGDCSAFAAGKTEIQRLFQADHEYRTQGKRTASVKVLKGEHVLGRDSVDVTIAPPPSRKMEFDSRD